MKSRLPVGALPRLVGVIILGIILTGLVWRALDKTEQARVRLEFENRALELELAITKQVHGSVLTLEAVAGLFHAFKKVDRFEFHTFAESMVANSDSIYALGWVPKVLGPERDAIESKAKESGVAEFAFTELDAQGELVPRSPTDIYFPVLYIEPQRRNLTALGFDLGSEPDRLEALEQSMIRGEPVATAPIVLVQDLKDREGLLIYWPVFIRDRGKLGVPPADSRNEALLGYISGVFRVGILIDSALADLDFEGIGVELYDESSTGDLELIHQIGSPKDNQFEPVGPTYLGDPKMPGRTWRIEIKQKPEFRRLRQSTTSLLIIPGGLLITLLVGLFYSQSIRHEKLVGSLRFARVVEAFPQAVFLIDDNGFITLANQASEKLFGLPPDSILGQLASQFVPFLKPIQAGEGGQTASPKDAAAPATESTPFARHQNGTQIPVAVIQEAVDMDDGPQTLAIIEDITLKEEVERRRKEYELKLEESNEALQHFAYVASHDLKAPLRSVGGFTDLLQKRYHGKLDEEADEWITLVMDAVKKMQILIDDLLAFSHVNSNVDLIEKLDTQEVLDEVCARLRGAIEESGARISVAGDGVLPTLVADRRQLVQLFQNLVENAIKYRRNDVTPQIEISANRIGAENSWEFTVKDNGIGIPADHHKEVFEIFHRLHPSDEYSGSGIGLAMCRRVAKRHGGDIWIGSDTAEGKGTEVCVRISEAVLD